MGIERCIRWSIDGKSSSKSMKRAKGKHSMGMSRVIIIIAIVENQYSTDPRV